MVDSFNKTKAVCMGQLGRNSVKSGVKPYATWS